MVDCRKYLKKPSSNCLKSTKNCNNDVFLAIGYFRAVRIGRSGDSRILYPVIRIIFTQFHNDKLYNCFISMDQCIIYVGIQFNIT